MTSCPLCCHTTYVVNHSTQMLTNASHNWYNSRIIQRHEDHSRQCAEWVDHYNWMLGNWWNDESTLAQFHQEMLEYRCYDV